MTTRLVTPDGRLGLRAVRGGWSVMDMRTRAETFLSRDGLQAFVDLAQRELDRPEMKEAEVVS